MPDRSFIMEIILRARDETARGFASAFGQMEAYDKKLDEQRVKSDALTETNNRLAKSHKDLENSQKRLVRGNDEVRRAQENYRVSTQQLARTEGQYSRGSLTDAAKLRDAKLQVARAQDNLRLSI